jgi:hypothetical protein
MSTALAYGNSQAKSVTHSRPGTGCVQAKLKVGAVNDPQEKEADQVAERVMRMPSNAGFAMSGSGMATSGMSVQRKCSSCEQEKKVSRKETAVMRTLARPSIQRKCASCENEKKVSRKEKPKAIAPPKLQRKCASCEHEEKVSRKEQEIDEPKLQRKCASCENEEKLSRKAEVLKEIDQPEVLQAKSESASAAGGSAPSSVQSGIAATRGGGTTLPGHVSRDLGGKMGGDFSGVRIHDTSHAAKMNDSINARAFTVGNNIYFNKGEYNPNSQNGKFLLAHELTHTMQQGASPEIQRYSWDEFAGDVAGGVDAVGEGLSDAAGAVGDAASAVGGAVSDAAGAVYDAGVDAIDWLATEAGQAAQALANALGVDVRITTSGLEIDIPGGCPLDGHSQQFTLDAMEKELMIPIFAIPIAPDVFISGEIGITGSITPEVQVQIGPICFDPTHILINPLTSNYSISGGISITSALSLGAELRGGIKGELSLSGIIPVGPVPVPVSIPLLSAEGGPAVFARAIGMQTTHIGGSLSYGGGTITASPDVDLDFGIAADLFAGAYAQLSVLGFNLCRIYWQPYEWHGDAAASLGLSGSISGVPGVGVTGVSVATPTITGIPFDNIGLAIDRSQGFTDDCPLLTGLCGILRALSYLPSQNGGSWDPTGTGHGRKFGPGPRLAGPMEVYQKNPGITSTAECRGACGVNCDTCEHLGTKRILDPVTGITWIYDDFQDCNTHDGCRQHDAGFDWAADVKGETGAWAIILPWHMAANIECGCNNLAGNCPAWAFGLPPYDGKMYFAASAKPAPPVTPVGPVPPVITGDDPIGEVGPDFYHYSARTPSGNFSAGVERWTDYRTNCRAEARVATGVPDDFNYISTLSSSVADSYINRDQYNTRYATSVIYGIPYPYNHYTNHTEIPSGNYSTASLSIFTPNCRSAGAYGTPTGNEEQDLASCDRHELPPDYCEELRNRVIDRFGGRERNLDFNPDNDIDEGRRRVDDTPTSPEFRRLFNRLDSWDYFIQRKHNEWYNEFDTNFQVKRDRKAWMDELKLRTEEFKAQFRDLQRQDTQELVDNFERDVLHEMEGRISQRIHDIAVWYKQKTGSDESLEELTERIHAEGTELWRDDWRAAILAVNRVLSRLWPPAKNQLISWVAGQRAAHPNVDFSGPINDIDYVGSLATGYKGVPKQFVRFNPRNFDVDANIVAPPLERYAVDVKHITPKHNRIFAIGHGTDITPLITFCNDAHREMTPIPGYDASEQFDVVIAASATPAQDRTNNGINRVYALRGQLEPERYTAMVNELRAAGLLVDEEAGWRLKPELSEEEMNTFNQILARYE